MNKPYFTKITGILLLSGILSFQTFAQGFASASSQWNMPSNVDENDWKIFDTYSRRQLIDMDGDGKLDLVDSENENTTSVSDVFKNGNQKYWKVYLNNGSGFAVGGTQWNIPANIDENDWKTIDNYSRHQLMDMNGDGKPDLVDSENELTASVSDVFMNGNQKYWKVYLNTGSGFSATATQWNIPANMDENDWKISDNYSRHQLMDMDGDGKPDLVDSENELTASVSDVFKNGNQKYWKVYLNTGSGFSATATQWNIPANMDENDWKIYDTYSRHQLEDMNGDGKPDLVDSENELTASVSDVFKNGSQKYWKVYLNTGSGFSATATQWNIPANIDENDWKIVDTYSRHQLLDIDGDGKSDLVDSENELTASVSDVFKNGNQKYWKVYTNTGSGFSATAAQWNIPANIDENDWKIMDTYSRHHVEDINGDGKPDMIDSENEITASVSDIFKNGSQKYWKVYLSTISTVSVAEAGEENSQINVYPNPAADVVNMLAGEALAGTAYLLRDNLGRLILSGELVNGINSFDVSNLQKGLYFIQFDGHGRTIELIKL